MLTRREFNYVKSNYGISYEKLRYHSLHHAVSDGRISQIRLLIKLHPELLNIRTESGLTALMIACLLPNTNMKEKIINMILRCGELDCYIKDHSKRSVVFYFIYFTNLELLRQFMEVTKYNYFTETDIDGYSLLHYAVDKEDLNIIEYILELFRKYKVDLNVVSEMNFTPLLLACRFGKYKAACLLLKLGCLPLNIRDNEQFRNCLEYVNLWKIENDNEIVNNLFIFDNLFETQGKTMPIVLTSRSENSQYMMGPRSHSCQSRWTSRDSPNDFQSLKMNPTYSFSLSLSSSATVQSILNLSPMETKELVRDLLMGNRHRLQHKNKRVSILVHDQIFQIRSNSQQRSSFLNRRPSSFSAGLPRISSSIIAHRLLDHVASDMFSVEFNKRF